MIGTSDTPYDLRFRLLDIPVRVQPFFWLISAVLGWQDNNVPMVLVWVACVFVSVLVHEYGHGLMARAFHCSPSIILWGLGGLCDTQSSRQTPSQRLAVVLSGPGGHGFVLCLLVMAVASLIWGITPAEHLSVVQYLIGMTPSWEHIETGAKKFDSHTYSEIYHNLVWINLMWGLVNLLPILPLDGGRVSEIAFAKFDRYQGTRRAHILSLLTAGCLALIAYGRNPSDLYIPIFFAMLAFINLQSLQTIHQAHRLGLHQDDDWWRG